MRRVRRHGPGRGRLIGGECATGADGAATPRRADRVVNVLRLLLSWAVDRGWRKDNPAVRPGRLRTGPGYRRGTAADVPAFLACAEVREPLKRAAALGCYTGQRKQDCLAMTKAERKGGELEVTPEKSRRCTGARLRIPEHPALTVILDSAPTSATVTLADACGRPFVGGLRDKGLATERRAAERPVTS